MSVLRVEAANGSYNIVFGNEILSGCGEMIAEIGTSTSLIVTDENVAQHYLKSVQNSAEGAGISCAHLVLPAGESSKCPDMLMKIYEALAGLGVNRSGCIIALGGGVVGDISGYAAATYMRGIAFVQIPTTLLSQVDSSVGGKTGIDLPFAKNIVGAFHQPSLVIADMCTLKTLPERELAAGYAEVIKYGAIADENLNFDVDMANVVRRCCEIKAEYVKADPYDKGVRMELNFGHTLGHAIEVVSNMKVLHGEGVALGMIVFAGLGEKLGITEQGTTDILRTLLKKANLPIEMEKYDKSQLFSAMSKDKKGFGEDLTIVLLERFGKALLHKMKREELFLALEELI